jgi:hypothetical protein
MESIANLTYSSKNDILDPLSIIIKLFIYSMKPVGSKISIGNNRLYIQENTYIQGVWRKWNGDTKNDINILLCPILYACIHYLKQPEHQPLFMPIFKQAQDGLVNMKQTYAGTPIVYNIEHIANILNMFLDNPDAVNVHEANSIVNIDTPMYKIKENIYHHLNDSWTNHRKNILFGYVKEILEVNNTTLKGMLIDGLSKFMECMDTIVANVLLNNRI